MNFEHGTFELRGIGDDAPVVGTLRDGLAKVGPAEFHVTDLNQLRGAPGAGDKRGPLYGSISDDGVAESSAGNKLFRVVLR